MVDISLARHTSIVQILLTFTISYNITFPPLFLLNIIIKMRKAEMMEINRVNLKK